MYAKKVHAMSLSLEVLCNVRGATRTSILRNPYDRDRLAKLVTCKLCRARMVNRTYST